MLQFYGGGGIFFPIDEASVVVARVWFLGTAPAEPGVPSRH